MKSRQLFGSILLLILLSIYLVESAPSNKKDNPGQAKKDTPAKDTLDTTDTTDKKDKSDKKDKPDKKADCSDPTDLAFVVDGSGICGTNATCNEWKYVLDFMVDIVTDMDIGPQSNRVGLIMTSATATIGWNYSRYQKKADLISAIRGLSYSAGKRDMVGGLRQLGNMVGRAGDRPKARNVAMVITAGKPTVPSSIRSEVQAVQSLGCTTYAVGITSQVDEYILQQLSSPPYQLNVNYFMVANFILLKSVRIQVERVTFCNSKSSTIVSGNNQKATQTYQSTSPSTARPTTTLKPETKPTPFTTFIPVNPIGSSPLSIQTPISHTDCSSNVLDLVFVVDGSGSICDNDPGFQYGRDTSCNNWNYILQFIANMVNATNVGPNAVRVGLVVFNTGARIAWDLQQYSTKTDVMRAIYNLPYPGGTTDTAGGINLMRTQVFSVNGDRPDVPNVGIIITDGKPTNPSAVPPEIDAAHNQEIKTYAVGVTNQVDEPTLQTLSSDPHTLNQNYFMAADYSTIGNVTQTVLRESICQVSSTSGPEPTPSLGIGTTSINLGTPSGLIDCKGDRLDLVFVVDGSGSICDSDPDFRAGIDLTCNNWNSILKFIADLVNSMEIGLDSIRVGLVSFASTATLEWNLTKYTSKTDLINAINGLTYPFGTTNTSGGINVMRNEAFGANGDRPDVKNVAIIITDGMPSDPASVPPEINAAHDQGVTTYAVGVTNEVNDDTLKILSSAPQELNRNYFVANDFNTIETVGDALLESTCSTTP